MFENQMKSNRSVTEFFVGHTLSSTLPILVLALLVLGFAIELNHERDLSPDQRHPIRLMFQYLCLGDAGPIGIGVADVMRDKHAQAGLNPWADERQRASARRDEIQKNIREFKQEGIDSSKKMHVEYVKW